MKVAFYKSKKKLFNRLVAWWTKGPYSHCELVTGSDGVSDRYVCYSSSIGDGGVRRKVMTLPSDKWDIVELDGRLDAKAAEQWFIDRLGRGYDFLGLFGFVIRPVPDSKSRYFCSEAVAESLGIPDAARVHPNMLYEILNGK